MSGGSYDYVSFRMDEAVETLRSLHRDQPHVIALADHLAAISSVMHDIEWADSCDTAWDAELDAKIRAVLAPSAELSVVMEQARTVAAHLVAAIAVPAALQSLTKSAGYIHAARLRHQHGTGENRCPTCNASGDAPCIL